MTLVRFFNVVLTFLYYKLKNLVTEDNCVDSVMYVYTYITYVYLLDMSINIAFNFWNQQNL